MRLYHYTCEHVAGRITRYGTLLPQSQPVLGGGIRLVWLTNAEQPDREALGLTSHWLSCDRTEVRYVVDTEDAQPWQAWADANGINRYVRAHLELERKPEQWFVSTKAVPATRDRQYRKAA